MTDAHDPWSSSDTAPALPWARWVERAEPWMWALVAVQALCAAAALLGVASLLRGWAEVAPGPVAVLVGLPVAALLVPSALNVALSWARARMAWTVAAPHVPASAGPVRLLRVGPLLVVSMALLLLPGALGMGALLGWLPPGLLGWTPPLTLLLGGFVLPAGVFGWDGALARLLPRAGYADKLAFEARWAGVVSWSTHVSWLVGAGRLDDAARILAIFHRRSSLFVPSMLLPLGAWCLATGRVEAASAVYDGARKLHPGDPRALAGWAEARLAAGVADEEVLAALDEAALAAAAWRWRWNRPGWAVGLACLRAKALAAAGRREGARLAIEGLRPTVSRLGHLARAEAEAALRDAELALGDVAMAR